MKRLPGNLKTSLLALIIIIFMTPIMAYGKFASNIGNTIKTSIKVAENVSTEKNLPVVGSYDNFKKLLEKSESIRPFYRTAFATAEKSAAAASPANDYSNTNVQVQGVDESDIIKTDGEYIYQVINDRLVIVKAYPASDMKVVNTIKYDTNAFYPNDIYVNGNNLIVIGRKYVNINKAEQESNAAVMKKVINPVILTKPVTKVIVYDTTDKSNIKIKRTIEVDGDYLTSRMINSKFYMITNKYVYDYRIMTDIKPSFKDSAFKAGKENVVDFKDIRYFPGYVEPNYMIISSFDILKPEKADIQTYLGSGQNVYVTNENIYVAVSEYETPKTEGASRLIAPTYNVNTILYKFNIAYGVKYAANGKVPGSILNQFSMDEYNGYFRIATTKGFAWGEGDNIAKNNLYILDADLNITGKIEDLAPGETIKSARFMGEKIYIVTFKNVDPLFVIDAKNAKEPKILGFLKIPGFSTYLHPYDETHIIGFGVDTKDVSTKDWNGNDSTITIQNGLKMSMFDVSDFENPKEMFSEYIGNRGSYSELLYNHKALLFSKEKNIFAFPVTVYEAKDRENPFDYGYFTYQGAYIYGIDLEKGFVLNGKITHLSDEDYKKAGDFGFDYNKSVQRIIYIDNVLYTISNGIIKANDIETMQELNSINLN
ncbi:Beta propeller domain protein [Caloramator mitchellensis]|uniref:Beta propeller domain protein n=1 Tax=Caloramator mitchellensis TaxID=908809 RepID=A0A0R3JUN9_CALMK|nr:beta-propeller domain-containing protein [Caloramator mitchellensis]KRQ86762.1 Beta propeller domain protein [Caloramator mitchellensis]